jgi:cell division protein FtsW
VAGGVTVRSRATPAAGDIGKPATGAVRKRAASTAGKPAAGAGKPATRKPVQRRTGAASRAVPRRPAAVAQKSQTARTTRLRVVEDPRAVAAAPAASPAPRLRDVAASRTSVEYRVLFVAVAGLSLLGLPMVLSASAVSSVLSGSSPYSMFERQCIFMVAAVAVGGFAYFLVPMSRLRRWRFVLLFGSMAALVAVFVPGVGHYAGGSSRWIGLGAIQIQPSELMKISIVVFAADLLARRSDRTDYWAAVVRPLLIVLAAAAGLIVAQPDLGTAIVIACIAFVMMFGAGVPLRVLVTTVVALALPAAYVALHAAYRRDRLLSFLHPFAHASGTGYQVVQALSTLGMGGIGGNGIGGSPTIWGFLPNAQTDFVFAVIGGNLGLLGSVAVVALVGLFGWAGLRIAAREQDLFSRYVAVGITCWILCQAVINVAGVIDALPVTGIPLPFISYGGSALVVEMAGAGLLLGLARRQRFAAR